MALRFTPNVSKKAFSFLDILTIATNSYGSSNEVTVQIDITPIISHIDTSGFARGVTLSLDDSKAYVADNSSGLQIIDISGF